MRSLLFLVVTAAMLAAANAPELVLRDAAAWPFAASSPWNTAIGDQAAFTAISSPRFASAKGGSVNATGFSHPVFIATAADPEIAIFKTGSASPFATVRVPAAAQPDAQGDGHLHLIDEQHRSVIEMWQAVRSEGRITAVAVVRNDLTDDGVYGAWHGVRAYGGSAIAGLIRTGELKSGIRHALAIAVEQQSLNRSAPGGKGWVWPASSCDNHNAYGATGNLFMGSLLAIPPTVDLRKLGLGPEAVELAVALQDYGAYITDCTGSNLSFYAEPAAAEEAALVGRGEASRLVALLQAVANNGPQTIGGGGKPRRAAAPPFAPPGQGVSDGGTAPAITEASTDTAVDAGQALRLTVTATGSAPLTYRWRRGGVVVPGDSAVFEIASAQPADAGAYSCTVANRFGRIVSSRMRVTVGGDDGAAPARGPVRPDAATLTVWNGKLRAAVRASIAAHREPRFRSELLHAMATVHELADDGLLTIAVIDAGGMQVPWERLRDAELRDLALDVARGDAPEAHALAGFYLLLAGDALAARTRLERAGAAADQVEAAFGLADPR